MIIHLTRLRKRTSGRAKTKVRAEVNGYGKKKEKKKYPKKGK